MSRSLATFVIAFALGFLYSEHRHASHVYTISGLQVLSKADDFNYMVRFKDDKQPWNFRVCPDYNPSWDPGMTLTIVKYEDFGPCKSLAAQGLGFDVERNPLTTKFIDFRR